jgi:hypothetical protein
VAFRDLLTTQTVTLAGENLLVRSYDPDNEDVVVSVPADLDGGNAVRKVLRQGQYQVVGDDFPGPLADGPSMFRPTG